MATENATRLPKYHHPQILTKIKSVLSNYLGERDSDLGDLDLDLFGLRDRDLPTNLRGDLDLQKASYHYLLAPMGANPKKISVHQRRLRQYKQKIKLTNLLIRKCYSSVS